MASEELDQMWTPVAREALAQAAREAAKALEQHAARLTAVEGEEAYDLDEAMQHDGALRAALLAYDDAAFDYSGSFPICLPDDSDELDDDDEDDGDEDLDDEDDSEEQSGGEPGFVTLLVRADYVLTDPAALRQHAKASDDADLDDVLGTAVDGLLGTELVSIPGMQEVRKAMFPVLMEELEDDETFATDPMAVLDA